MKVLKFGGSSVATPARIKSVIEIVKPYLAHEKITIVFSAFGGVTDTLIQLSTLALQGNTDYKKQLEQIEKRHLEAVRELVDMQRQSTVIAQVKITINELEDILNGILVRDCRLTLFRKDFCHRG
jgi:aspartokinase/homoserine dehydrogenase 1